MSYSNGLAALRREAASIAEWDDKGKGKNNKGLGKGMGKSKTDSSKGKGKNSNGTSNEASLWDDPEGARLWRPAVGRSGGIWDALGPEGDRLWARPEEATLAFPGGGFPGGGFPGGGFPDGGFLTPLPESSFSTLQPSLAAASPAAATPLPEEATPLPDEFMPPQEEAPQEEAMQVQPLALAGLHQRRRWRSSLPAHLTAAGRCSSSSSGEAPP
jgi:hypothetical protein